MSYIEPGDRPVPQFESQAGTPRQPRRRGSLILVGVLLVIFGFGVWYAYSQGVQRGNNLVPPLIKAEQGPVKVQPDNPGGLQVPNQDKQIYESLGSNGNKNQQAERLLPPPEQPRAEAPRSQTLPQNLPPPPANAVPPASEPQRLAPPPQQTAAVPRSVIPVSPLPGAASAPAPVAPVRLPPAAPPPRAAATALPASPPPTTASGGGIRIQLGSLGEANAAEAEWRRLANAYGDVLGGLQHYVERVELPDKGTRFRIQAGGFSDRATASAVCDRLRARAPSQGCIVAAR